MRYVSVKGVPIMMCDAEIALRAFRFHKDTIPLSQITRNMEAVKQVVDREVRYTFPDQSILHVYPEEYKDRGATNMMDIEEQIHEAVAQAAAVDRAGNDGLHLRRRISVTPSRSHIQRFRSRLLAFLENVPEDLTVNELIDLVRR